ncbi:rRNA maturation RNase YbeY [Mesoplasma photuris]|uniref:rRNA maturation RNase YbeY n=1 Tax=Mesoplasma photuris TaxID=217731 RepID=UPI0004E0C106|nr:rRNA maturation RNase YbeY [Mesoplasma photuris]
MFEIEFYNKTKLNTLNWEKFANNILESAKNYLKIPEDLLLSISFVDSDEAQQINIQYRNHSYIADVTSFPTEMSDEEVKIMGFRELGDLFICIEEAERKAVKYKHSIEEEMGFLFVHGFLHLLGYDHETNLEDEMEMFALQDKILKLNNINYEIKFLEEDYNDEGE